MTKSVGFDIFRAFATDPNKEVNGVRKAIAPGAFLVVAREGNRAYDEALASMLEDNKEALDKGDEESRELSEALAIELIAKYVLIGFEGLAWKGKPAPYSVEMAKEMLGAKEFRMRVLSIARDVENYRYDAEDASAKN